MTETAGTIESRLKIAFFGTPAFAVPALERLAGDERFVVALVVTQPDRPAGRGRSLVASPVKRAAEQLGLTVYQPDGLRAAAGREPLAVLEADLFVVAAYGLIFGRRTLALPRLGCLNLHASVLPRHRGASPIAAAILSGDGRTGVSLMAMEPGLDNGPVIAVRQTVITGDDTTASLTERLAEIGARLATEAIPEFAAGRLPAVSQPVVGVTVTRPLTKADGWLDWTRSAKDLERQVRAMWPWPRAWTTLRDVPLQIHRATVVDRTGADEPGSIQLLGGTVSVRCGQGALRLDSVQRAGGRPVSGPALIAGGQVNADDRMGDGTAPAAPAEPIVQEVK